MKRTRPMKKWIITVPHLAIRKPGIYRITMKVSQVTIERVGEIKRGSVDGEEGG